MSSQEEGKKSEHDFARLRKDMEDLDYPPNYDFDPETLEPKGDLKERIKCLRETAPEMMEGGGDFLDVGSNKGFLPLYLRRQFENLTGVEPIQKYVDFSNSLAEAHGAENVGFVCTDWQSLPTMSKRHVVYCGGVHHHGYNDCVKDKSSVFDFMKVVASVAREILVIDGPWHLNNPKHNTAGALANEHHWTQEQRDSYTLEKHAEAIADDFDLVRQGPSGTGDRKIVVFRRKDVQD